MATWSRDTAHRGAQILRAAGVELAVGTDLRTLRYLLALDPGMRLLLDEPDVSPFTFEAAARIAGLGRLRAFSRYRKYRRLLQRAAQRLDAALVASTLEADAYRSLSGSSRIAVIENGVANVSDQSWHVPVGAQLLYPGSLTYGPNLEAVTYFSQSILPLVEKEIPDVGLVVTGTKPETVPQSTTHHRLMLTGRLDQAALDAAHRGSRACVIPLLSGTGTRIKILEAMALGIPIISTSKGAEGLAVVPGEHLLIADDPVDFAQAVIRVLRDVPFAEDLGRRGQEIVRQRYDWRVIGESLRVLVRNTLTSYSRGDAWQSA